MTATLPHPTAHTVPSPVLFNAWKHHAGWVRGRIASAAAKGDVGLKELADVVVVTGTKLMDFYTGTLDPWAVGEKVIERLQSGGVFDRDPFAEWVAETDGYRLLDVSDGSRWVVRAGDGERYVHLHTARYSLYSLRVPGITLKTAIVANAMAVTRGQPVADLRTVNDARRDYLSLPPVAHLAPDGGLGEVLRLLAVVG